MFHSIASQPWAMLFAALALIAGLMQSGADSSPAGAVALENPKPKLGGMSPQKKAEALGIKFGKVEPKYLNHCVKTGKLLFTSGFGSKTKGRLGKDGFGIEEGRKAARECAVEILQAVYDRHGTLDNLRVVKVLGCVNSTPDFYDQPKVMNGCSDLFHEIFGAKTDGWHARSALGFAALPNGCAVEIEAIFEIKD
jgi:enamine deaminase RidA (YjgF/YER057c/UK114 family)